MRKSTIYTLLVLGGLLLLAQVAQAGVRPPRPPIVTPPTPVDNPIVSAN